MCYQRAVPHLSCLFGAATGPLLTALAEDADCRDRLHRFDKVTGVRLHGGELLAVRLQGSVDAPWPHAREGDWRAARERWAGTAAREILTPPLQVHSWLPEGLPPPEVVARWSRVAAVTGEKLAYWWWWERGDDLYADVAWLFSPETEVVLVRETFLMSGDDKTYSYTSETERARVETSPLQAAMEHLGFESLNQYFVPSESWDFDWEAHRVSGAGRAS
ncbi:MAG: hypothetical protein R3F14_38215 [Polyangiaceae bacterium]